MPSLAIALGITAVAWVLTMLWIVHHRLRKEGR